jgi:hypothetical protein
MDSNRNPQVPTPPVQKHNLVKAKDKAPVIINNSNQSAPVPAQATPPPPPPPPMPANLLSDPIAKQIPASVPPPPPPLQQSLFTPTSVAFVGQPAKHTPTPAPISSNTALLDSIRNFSGFNERPSSPITKTCRNSEMFATPSVQQENGMLDQLRNALLDRQQFLSACLEQTISLCLLVSHFLFSFLFSEDSSDEDDSESDSEWKDE